MPKKPISDHCDGVLRSLPLPSQEINPGNLRPFHVDADFDPTVLLQR